MDPIDAVRINFNPDQLRVLNFMLAFLMFGVALDLRVSHFKAIFTAPKPAAVGLFSQWIMLPIITIGLIFLFKPPASLALGMALVAACPGGNVSNFAVHMGKGNAALSVLLTSITTILAIFFTPLFFSVLIKLIDGAEKYGSTIEVNPFDMIRTIFLLIMVPLILGMASAVYFPNLVERIKKPVQWLSMAIFLGFVVVAIKSNLEHISKYLHLIFFLVLIHNSLGLATGYGLAKAAGLSRADARAISLETGIQNSGLGLILIFNFFGGLGGMALIAAWWGIWHLISAFTLATIWARRGG